ncbi:ureidoglycolate lyase [Roseobacter denitrificans]|uniref:Ureidoglycolate lyase n=1 Tax=Roseobacter denitrificans (strain ATCC 33942 / OCh 114) TaxID=375451 RepID=Q160K1_ROSDO|nr:ureidoglycolate lyase [Roseobacter denitrificans]ABG33592.1 ureidoglycolate hydrolase [Roseobacter denitrificans OCh 114]AVL52893.1 ureidoglycolate lyase [Roseobacter denitrificans]SFG03934.1 ureidoglycolate lyase [Roseobacter denitrificans OCh 114]
MSETLHLEPLSAQAFAPFGDVLEATGTPDKIINQGLCGRFHDLATMDFTQGRAGISLFSAQPRQLPLKLEMVERHPEGSQAFIPMSMHPFLVIVAEDAAGHPKNMRAFLTEPGQGVNYHKGTWHGVLTPLHAPGLFAVVDRIGPGSNLEEYWFDHPLTIDSPK